MPCLSYELLYTVFSHLALSVISAMPKEDDLESSKHVSRQSTCTDPENVHPEKASEPEVEIVELEGEENPRQWRLRKKATMLALASLFSLLS